MSKFQILCVEFRCVSDVVQVSSMGFRDIGGEISVLSCMIGRPHGQTCKSLVFGSQRREKSMTHFDRSRGDKYIMDTLL